MQRNGIHILALLYELLIAGYEYSNSVTPICQNAAKALKTIVLLPTTGFFLKSFPLSSSCFTKLLCVARAISICSTAGLPLWIGFLTASMTPRLTFKNSALNIAISEEYTYLEGSGLRIMGEV